MKTSLIISIFLSFVLGYEMGSNKKVDSGQIITNGMMLTWERSQQHYMFSYSAPTTDFLEVTLNEKNNQSPRIPLEMLDSQKYHGKSVLNFEISTSLIDSILPDGALILSYSKNENRIEVPIRLTSIIEN